MKYKSELIKDIVDTRGHEKSSLHYESECVESWIEETKGAYPKLCDYESEWLNYINENPIGEFPYMTLSDVTQATVNNVVPYAYKSAILKGNTDENLQSVKMPVLTTTGKNLFDENRRYESSHKLWFAIPFEKDSYFTFSSFDTLPYIEFYGTTTEFVDKSYGGDGVSWEPLATFSNKESGTFKKESKYNYIIIAFDKENLPNEEDFLKNLQVEQGTQATSYEPFKSNILTTSEEVELRGIGDVKDELNLMTGELTQRVGEIVLDGSDSIEYQHQTTNENTLRFFVKCFGGYDANTNIVVPFLTDSNLPKKNNHSVDEESIFSNWGGLYIRIAKEKLTENSVKGFKLWLSQNPITFQYQLVTSIVKTVDLTITNQDGETLNKLKPIEGTMHITASGTPINPTVSLEIPVEAITQNLNSFIEEE